MKTKKRTRQLARMLVLLSSLGVLSAVSVVAAPEPSPGTASAPSADASASTAAANTPAAPDPLKPILPMAFSDFAADYQAKIVGPPWLTVHVGTLETNYQPPAGKTSFWLDDSVWTAHPEFSANYHSLELACLTGAKARFDNVTLFDLDKTGHPLGYTVSLGQIVYFLSRGETPEGIAYSIHYYDSGKSLTWIPNPDSEKKDTYIPILRSISVTKDLAAPADSYVFLYLSQRTGALHPDSTARPLTLYTYLVVHVHPVPSTSPTPPTGIVPKP